MSRFLKKRHYDIVLPGIALLKAALNKEEKYPYTLTQVIHVYMDRTGVAYTQKDTEEIQTLYIQKYGQL